MLLWINGIKRVVVVYFENNNEFFISQINPKPEILLLFFFSTGDVHLVEFDFVVNLLS